MSRRILEFASWIAGIVSAIVAIAALFWSPKTETTQQSAVPLGAPKVIASQPESLPASVEVPKAPIVSSNKPSESANSCPTKTAISAAADKAADISIYDERNSVYRSLVQDALCLHDFELAKSVADKISGYDSRNSAYVSIVDAALQAGFVDVADATANSITVYDQRNAAKKKIVYAIRSAK